MSNMKHPFERKTLKFLALILVTMLLGACSSTKGCVKQTCLSPIPDGWRLMRTELDDGNNGIINSITRYEYSPEGEMISMLIENLDSSSMKKNEYRHDFDDQGRLLNEKKYSDSNRVLETTFSYHYDRHGNHKKTSSAIGDIVFSYDSCRVQKVSIGAFRNVFTYDAMGRVLIEHSYNLKEGKCDSGTFCVDGVSTRRFLHHNISYVYDESGRLVRKEGDMETGRPHVWHFEYNDLGHLSRELYVVTRKNTQTENATYYYWEEIGDTSAQMRYTHPCP